MKAVANLKKLRKERNISQQDVADYLHITRAAYTNIENGKRETDFNGLSKLAEYFGVTADYLLGRTDEPAQKNAPPPSRSAMEDEIIERLEILSPAEQQEALGYLDFLVHRRNSDAKAP